MRQQGCNTRTHDAEAVAFESLFLSLFKRLLRGGDGVWFTIRDDQDDLPVLAEETHLLHDPPERFRHRSHPVGDFGESGGELFTVPKNRGVAPRFALFAPGNAVMPRFTPDMP